MIGVLLLASVIGAPDTRTLLAQAALAFASRPAPRRALWTIAVRPRGGESVETVTCTLDGAAASRDICAAPDGSSLYFTAGARVLDAAANSPASIAGVQPLDGSQVYDVAFRIPDSGVTELWIGTDDYEVRKVRIESSTYTFAQYGGMWWISHIDAPWGTADTLDVRFSEPKTIAHIRVTPLCSTVRSLVVPFLKIDRSDRELFSLMDRNVAHFWQAAQVASDPGSPGLILARGNLDWYAAQTYVHLADADMLLKRSYERVPPGINPPLDAIRLRIQALVDLERIETNEYAGIAAPRETAWRYWEHTVAEAGAVARLDSRAAATPPPEAFGEAWIASELTEEQKSDVPELMTAADYCGERLP